MEASDEPPAPTAGRPRHHVVEVALTLDPVARATQDLAATHAHVARTVRRLCRSSAPDDAKAAAVEAAVEVEHAGPTERARGDVSKRRSRDAARDTSARSLFSLSTWGAQYA